MAVTDLGTGYIDIYSRSAVLCSESAFSPTPGEGICIFFYDADYNFHAGGIGSSMGYANYRGELEYLSGSPVETTLSANYLRGIPGAFLGVSLDIGGDFSTANNGKTYQLGTSAVPASGLTSNPNTICVRGPSLSAYQILTTTDNLSTYSLAISSAPPFTLHQSVTSRSDVAFKSVKVSLIEGGQRCLVYLKEQTGPTWYKYADIDISAIPRPENVKVGMSFATSTRVMKCELKNFAVTGKFKNISPTYNGHSGVWSVSGWLDTEPYAKTTYIVPGSSFLPETPLD